MRKFLTAAAALAALSVTAIPTQAHHFTIIGGSCFNPAGMLIPPVAAISNPHCAGGGGGGGGSSSKKSAGKSRSSTTGKLVVGCIMGSALGLITASAVKGNAYGYPTRWHSAKEAEEMAKTRNKEADLTSGEAQLIGLTCGAGAAPVIAKYSRPERTTLVAQFGRPAPRTAVAQVRQPAPRKSVAQVRRPAPRDALSTSKRSKRKTVIARNNPVFPLNLFGVNRIFMR